MVNVMEHFGNPFQEESSDLLVLDTKEIAPPAALDALHRAHEVGQLHFDNFTRERLVERTKPVEDAIHTDTSSKSLASLRKFRRKAQTRSSH